MLPQRRRHSSRLLPLLGRSITLGTDMRRHTPGDAMKVSLFYLPSLGSKADIEAGMAGTRADLYQQMLAEVSEQCRLADALGYDFG